MTKVTIIGATGSLGRAVTETLLAETDVRLTLFSRTAHRLPVHDRATIIAGSTADSDQLEAAVAGADLVFVALSGNLPQMTEQVIAAMKSTGTNRLVFISSYGIYGEIDGRPAFDNILQPYRKAADLVEQSDLDYTVLRPGWFDNGLDTNYQLIPKGETIYGHDISRKSIADLVKRIALDPTLFVKENLGIVR
ncbi:NAD(P)H-binding protein [Streptococcus merionis]|uniref:NmrA-like dehydrogenase/reductase n=1 Tax=Streptococcus merionis TaxID=400065 RepID=A0A239SP07_9STRE|nr:NAD(P)H-binding protein [Streptococcus merionis]SNU87130.1 NmrA-like dehydrogenase/reductase [Streptococcus merionis]